MESVVITPGTWKESPFDWEDANPLLDGIPRWHDKTSMQKALDYDPLLAYPRPFPRHRLPEMAELVRYRHVATPLEVEAALRLLRLLVASLKRQDPRLEANRRKIFELARLVGTPMQNYPWFQDGAPGAIIEALTGLGKSALIERFLSILGAQVRIHAESKACGWLEMRQLVWLKVAMPTTPHPSGLLLEIALEMDRVLGTSYTPNLLRRGTSLDRQISLVLLWLRTHRCGALIIEENQERNTAGEYGKNFLLFFLRMLNAGIFTVLIGNPLALRQIKKFAQDTERFAEGYWLTMWPTFFATQPAWSECLVPGIWNFDIFGAPDAAMHNRDEYLLSKTGGTPRHLSVLRRETMLAAIDAGAFRIEVEHIEKALQSSAVGRTRKLTLALVSKKPELLSGMTDVPVDDIVAQWALIEQAKERLRAEQAKLEGSGATPPTLPVTTENESTRDHGVASPNNCPPPPRPSKPVVPPSPEAPASRTEPTVGENALAARRVEADQPLAPKRASVDGPVPGATANGPQVEAIRQGLARSEPPVKSPGQSAPRIKSSTSDTSNADDKTRKSSQTAATEFAIRKTAQTTMRSLLRGSKDVNDDH